jgi:hypothetical protein
MSTLRLLATVSTLAATALYCRTPAGLSDGLAATVASAERSSTGIVQFQVDWRNVGTAPLYLAACGGRATMWLERRDASWEPFGGGTCLANLDQNPVQLDPGQTLRAIVAVGPGDAGTYRAVTSFTADLGREAALVRSPGAQVP